MHNGLLLHIKTEGNPVTYNMDKPERRMLREISRTKKGKKLHDITYMCNLKKSIKK